MWKLNSDNHIFIINNSSGIIKVVKLPFPIDDSAGCFKLKHGEKTKINVNIKTSIKLHIYNSSIILLKVDDLRLFKSGSIIEIT